MRSYLLKILNRSFTTVLPVSHRFLRLSRTKDQGFGSGFAWISIVFGSRIRIRIKVKNQGAFEAQKWSHGGLLTLKMVAVEAQNGGLEGL